MQTLRIGWRNLWRNKRRTVITVSAVTINTMILITNFALMRGLISHAVELATSSVVGDAQIHAPDYLSDRSLYKTVKDPEALLDFARQHQMEAVKRAYGYGLLAHDTKSAGALFWGVEPERERAAFDLAKHLQTGTFLPDQPGKHMVLGKRLAKSLQVKPGDEVILVIQAADGSLGNEIFTVSGILKSAGDTIDRNAALIHFQDYQDLFVAGGRVHEIAIRARQSKSEDLPGLFSPVLGGDELKTWRELLPVLADMMKVLRVAIWIFGSIFFLVAALGVLNTMLMATYERIREFGIQRALGATPWRIISDVVTEALVLALLSVGAGSILGLLLTLYFRDVGLNTSRWAGETNIAGLAFDPIWHADLSLMGIVLPALSMIVVCVLAAIYPGSVAARFDPIRSLQHH